MIEGYIHSIESMGLVDGPGIRTVVFFQGCRLRCRYCHNPDTWAMRSGKEQIFTPEQLVNKLLRFKPYFGDNGGVTFSGGEPLLQKDFLCEVLRLCKHAGIHTCIDTAAAAAAATRKFWPILTSSCWTSSTSRWTATTASRDSLRRSFYNSSPPCKTRHTPLDPPCGGPRTHGFRRPSGRAARVSAYDPQHSAGGAAALPHAGREQVSCTGDPVFLRGRTRPAPGSLG